MKIISNIANRFEKVFECGSPLDSEITKSKKLTSREKSTLCLFAHFDPHNIIDDYVVFYLSKLTEIADIVFITASAPSEQEIAKVASFCRNIIIRRNRGYDFGSWKDGLTLIDDEISDYKSLIMANDSVYAPLYDIKEMIDEMERHECDFWGITASNEIAYHLQSYFLFLHPKVFLSETFQQFWNKLKHYKHKNSIIRKYEISLSRRLLRCGFIADSYVKCPENDCSRKNNSTLFQYKELIIQHHAPVFKTSLLRKAPPGIDISEWRDVLSRNTDYDISMIVRHVERLKSDCSN